MTHRQFEAWQEWLRLDMNTPDRHDYYVMRVAQVLTRGAANFDDLKVKFDLDSPKALPTKKSAAPLAKMAIVGRFANVRHNVVDAAGNVVKTEVIHGGRKRA